MARPSRTKRSKTEKIRAVGLEYIRGQFPNRQIRPAGPEPSEQYQEEIAIPRERKPGQD